MNKITLIGKDIAATGGGTTQKSRLRGKGREAGRKDKGQPAQRRRKKR